MIKTRLTRRFNLTHTVVSAPMAKVGGGALAAAVSRAVGLGMIGPKCTKENNSER